MLKLVDIASDYWGYDYIYGLNYLNIINGYNINGEITFKPNANITRAEFIKLLVSAYDISLSDADGIELKFADRDKIPEWAVPYIKAAVMKGIVNGKNINNKNYFASSDNITREEMAAMIGRSLISNMKSSRVFNDQRDISSWSMEEINKLIELGIISGYEDNTFKPKNNATRTESAVMIYKYLKQIK